MRVHIRVLDSPIARSELQAIAEASIFEDMVKAVVDIERGIIAIGGELHADEEKVLLETGSAQQNLWGINLYPNLHGDAMVEFDSMINVRPTQGNRSRSVDDLATQTKILKVVRHLVRN
jgi:hypothetical protein